MTESQAKRRGIIITIIFTLFQIGGVILFLRWLNPDSTFNSWHFIDILAFATIFIAGYRGRNIGKEIIINQKDNFKEIHHFLTFTTTLSFSAATFLWMIYINGVGHNIFFSTFLLAFIVLIISALINLLFTVLYTLILTKG